MDNHSWVSGNSFLHNIWTEFCMSWESPFNGKAIDCSHGRGSGRRGGMSWEKQPQISALGEEFWLVHSGLEELDHFTYHDRTILKFCSLSVWKPPLSSIILSKPSMCRFQPTKSPITYYSKFQNQALRIKFRILLALTSWNRNPLIPPIRPSLVCWAGSSSFWHSEESAFVCNLRLSVVSFFNIFPLLSMDKYRVEFERNVRNAISS